MNIEVEKRELQRQIDTLLAKPSMTATERKQCDLLMSKVANLRSQEERKARLASAMADVGMPVTEEQRGAKIERAFDFYVRTGDASELRTYSPESTTSAGVLIAQQWAGAYAERSKSYMGLREAGCTVVTTSTGAPWKQPFSDDTANTGERLAENIAVSLANPTESSNTFGAYRYGSRGVQYSGELARDTGFDLNAYLQNIFAARIGRLTQSEFTLGASGITGVLPAISNVVTAPSTTAVDMDSLIDLQNIDAGYLSTSVYMLAPATARLLMKSVGSDGRRLYPEMGQGMLLGYRFALNTAMSAPAANSLSVAFGSFQRGVVIREVTPMLVVSAERYAEQGMMYASLTHRQDCQVVDANALSVLQQAAS